MRIRPPQQAPYLFVRQWLIPILVGMAGFGVVNALFAPILFRSGHLENFRTALVVEAAMVPVQLLTGGFATYYASQLTAQQRSSDTSELYSAAVCLSGACAPLVFGIMLLWQPLPIAAAAAANAMSLAANGAWRYRVASQRSRYMTVVVTQSLVSALILGVALSLEVSPSIYLLAQPCGALAGQLVSFALGWIGIARPSIRLLREAAHFLPPELLQWTFWSMPIPLVVAFHGGALAAAFGAVYKVYFVLLALPALTLQLSAQALGTRVWRDAAIIRAATLANLVAAAGILAVVFLLPIPSPYANHRSWVVLTVCLAVVVGLAQVPRVLLARDGLRLYSRVLSWIMGLGIAAEIIAAPGGPVVVLTTMVGVSFLLLCVVAQHVRGHSSDARERQ